MPLTCLTKGERRWQEGRCAAIKGLVWALVVLGLSTTSLAGEKQPKAVKVSGVVSAVEPTQVSVRGSKGVEVTLLTEEDYTQKVAVGSKVTAWYFSKDGANILQRFEYASQDASSPENQSRAQIRKIIILPSSTVGDADGVFDAIGKYLTSTYGWYVAPRVLAEEIRRRAGKPVSMLEAMDPKTGQFDMTKYLKGQPNLVGDLASETRVDAVLEVNIEQVMAKVHRMTASWDGVEEPVAGGKTRTFAKFSLSPAQGEVAASTVTLKLWDAEGKLLWSNRRGFAVLAVVEGGGLRYRPLVEYLLDSATVQKWLAKTFSSLPSGGSS